ncbi:uncharacterized protein LOC120611839 isoform X1 [Pteropus medius]|uniref:uncharacterized protein LOC120611839 isoform X1 n=1 Tax=Pteropus vampyrus TaxID=132908 RepID=UPI00196A32AD|nr:uncharacterized protein LOC120611839 isoform X1 [Pteropus giganteus]
MDAWAGSSRPPPSARWTLRRLPAEHRSLPPASEKTGTPVFLHMPLGDGQRGPAEQRQDKQVDASGGALHRPSLRSRVEAGPSLGGSWTQAATPTSLNWDCGERWRLHQGVACAGAALEQLSSHSMTSGDFGLGPPPVLPPVLTPIYPTPA